jgi:hypothetical protein
MKCSGTQACFRKGREALASRRKKSVKPDWCGWHRCSLFRATDQSIRHDTRVQESPDEFEHPFVRDFAGNPGHEHIMVYPVEEFLKVYIHHP